MFRVLLFAALLGAVNAAVATAAPSGRTASRGITAGITVTGEIGKLGLSRIAVGRVGCVVPAKLALRTDRFVIGDPVKITCLNGTLRNVKYAPEVATAQSSRPGGGNAPSPGSTPLPTPPPASGPAAARSSSSYFASVIFLGGGPTGETSTVTGPISDFSDSSVTVGDLTCSFKPASNNNNFFGGIAQIGDNVTLTCIGTTFTHLASVGTISH